MYEVAADRHGLEVGVAMRLDHYGAGEHTHSLVRLDLLHEVVGHACGEGRAPHQDGYLAPTSASDAANCPAEFPAPTMQAASGPSGLLKAAVGLKAIH